MIALSGRYGFHRDELYFLLAGRYPAWGYVDQPPLTPLLSRAGTAVFGASPTGLRVVPALFSACSVVLTALLARELGARRGGQVLAAACCACSGYVLAMGHLLSTSTFDLTAELGVLLLTLRLLRTRDSRWWPALGAVIGVTLLNKQPAANPSSAVPASPGGPSRPCFSWRRRPAPWPPCQYCRSRRSR
ncbi:ArnT family glycosyltransferase [Streptomyces violascens]|uniref:ArnT family glycosyltransferase n=1 Tax=Streptomyces violascens TaxID=67381 RepID=UPI00364DC4E4